jgi:hypothetical protein
MALASAISNGNLSSGEALVANNDSNLRPAPRAQLARTAVCGPACTVVWQGRVGDHSPYADLGSRNLLNEAEIRVGTGPGSFRQSAELRLEARDIFLKCFH